jgi:REP element-mobilizing transposase RayT
MIHIRNYAREKNIWIDHLNGYQNHIHCLISLRSDQALDEVINQIKGESSHWINQHYQMRSKFCWAVDYYAASVSLKTIPIVRQYIQNQECHHTHKTWAQEEEGFQRLLITPLSTNQPDPHQ